MRRAEALVLPSQCSVKARAVRKKRKRKHRKGRDLYFLCLCCSICDKKAWVNRGAVGSATPCLPGLADWLPLQEPQYFTAVVSAIDSAVNPTPHPWKRFRILIPLTPPPFSHPPLGPPPPPPHPSSSQSPCVQANKILCMIFLFLLSATRPLHPLFPSSPLLGSTIPSKESARRWLQLLWAPRMCSAQ